MITKLKSLTPPNKFLPADNVKWAIFCSEEPAYIKANKKRVTGSRAAGLRYESKAKEKLKSFFDAPATEAFSLSLGPWMEFRCGDSSRSRFCQPDAILVNHFEKRITIYEIKLQHCALAWWQVRKLYEPVLRHMFPDYTFSAIEIVKWLDPHTSFPETFYYAENVSDTQPNRFGVHIFDGRKFNAKAS